MWKLKVSVPQFDSRGYQKVYLKEEWQHGMLVEWLEHRTVEV